MIRYNIRRWKKENRKSGKEIRRRANERIKQRFKKPIPRAVVPSFFTLMNLFCGFLAIIQIYEGYLVNGAWLIVLAAFFDALDGFMARLTNGTSSFGVELDSLSDVVSFGAAPGFLVYVWAFSGGALALPLVAALPVLCGAVRLARFNVEVVHEDNPFFKGLPIPAQAMMLVAFFLTFYDKPDFFEHMKQGLNTVLIPFMVILSLLMVSTVPFDKLPRFKKEYLRKYRGTILLFIIYGLIILLLQEYGLMIVFSIFILKGLITSAVNFWKDIMQDEEPSKEPETEV